MYDALTYINIVLSICGVTGGIVAFLSARHSGITKIQEDTINALQIRVTFVEKELTQTKEDLKQAQEEKAKLLQIVEAIQSALLSRGMYVTIDGSMVFIADKTGHITKAGDTGNQ